MDLKIIKTAAELPALKEYLASKDFIAFDTETRRRGARVPDHWHVLLRGCRASLLRYPESMGSQRRY
jgi:hypothetical protein